MEDELKGDANACSFSLSTLHLNGEIMQIKNIFYNSKSQTTAFCALFAS